MSPFGDLQMCDSRNDGGKGLGAATGSDYQTRVTKLSVMIKGEPIFSETATHVELADEAAGEFVRVIQYSSRTGKENQAIAIDPEEWPHVKAAIEQLLPNAESSNPTKEG